MKLSELIPLVDKSERNEHHFSAWDSDLFRDLAIDVEPEYDALNANLKRYWLNVWQCTDTWVGLAIIFLNDECVGLSYQSGRKSQETYWWVSKQTRIDVRDYILSLIKPPIYDDDYEGIGLDEDISDLCKISYASEIIGSKTRKCLYNGEEVKIINTFYGKYDNNDVEIELPSGEHIITGCEHLDFPLITINNKWY